MLPSEESSPRSTKNCWQGHRHRLQRSSRKGRKSAANLLASLRSENPDIIEGMQSFLFYGLALVAVACYAALPVIAKKVGLAVPPFGFIAMTMAVLSIAALCASLVFERSFNVGNQIGR